jgi:hypothetical protein
VAAIAVVGVLVLLLTTDAAPLSAPRVGPSRAEPPPRATSTVAPVDGALAALERGEGPAHGSRAHCQLSSAAAGVCFRSTPSQDTLPPSWSPLTPPFTGWAAAFAYDATAGYAVLFGGNLGPSSVSDATWLYEGGIWKNVTANLALLPPARGNASLAYDPGLGGVVLFGGNCVVGQQCAFNDTWSFSGGAWQNLTAAQPNAANTPGNRESASLAFDPSPGSGLVLFGGWSYFGQCSASAGMYGICNDTWVFNRTWTHVATTGSPVGRYSAAMTWDPTIGRDLLFGGIDCFSFPPCPYSSSSVFRNDTWSYSAGVWTDITPSPLNLTDNPSRRAGAAMAYDPSLGGTVLFGGLANNHRFNDTWVYGSSGWRNLSLPQALSPGPQFLAAAAFDTDGGRLLIAGGADTCPAHSCPSSWSFDGSRWVGLGQSAMGPTTWGSAAAYDAHDSYVVVFGGFGAQGFERGTWRYEAGLWTNLTPPVLSSSNSPSGRYQVSMAYDEADGYVVLFSGQGCYGGVHPCRDTWKFSGGIWTNISAAFTNSTNTPPGRSGTAMAYDSTDGYVVMFGGAGDSSVLQDTWKFLGGNWTNLTPRALDVSNSPSPRFYAAMADDPVDGYLVLFGGSGCSGSGCGDSWSFSAGQWTLSSGSASMPGPRYGAAMAYDPVDGYVLMHGGDSNLCPGGEACPDSWAFSGGSWNELSATSVVPAGYLASMVDDLRDGYLLLQGAAVFGIGTFASYVASWAYVPGVSVGTPIVRPNPADANANVTISVSVGGGGIGSYALMWQGLPPGCASPGASVLSFACVTPAQGSYSIRALVTDSSGVSGDFSPWVVWTLGPHPSLSVPLPTRTTADVGQAVNFSTQVLVPAVAPDTIRWTFSPALGCGPSTKRWLNCTPIAAGSALSATATLTDGTGVTSSSTSPTILVSLALAVMVSANLSATDVGVPVNWTASVAGGSGGLGYQWSGLPAGCSPGSVAFVTCAPLNSSPLLVQVIVNDSNGGSTLSTSATVTVHPAPLVGLSVNRTSVALGDRVTLSAAAVQGTPPYVYSWLANGHPFLNRTSFDTTEFVPSSPGEVALSVIVTDSVGADGGSRSVPLNVTKNAPVPGPQPGPSPAGSGGSVPVWLIAILVGAAVAAIVGAVLYLRRRKPSSDEPAVRPSRDDVEDDAEPSL